MYEAHFQLNYRPFTAAADARRYVAVGSVEHARQTLVQLINRQGGAGLIIGGAGVGKTLLCQRLAAEYRKAYEVAFLASGRIRTCRALLQSICFEVGLPYRGLDEGELRLSIFDHLQSEDDVAMLLIVDEAHTLPSRLLEEVRMLSNHLRGGASRVQVLLAGSNSLEEKLASPKLESFSQRLGARCYLDSLNRDETATYVYAQLKAAGGKGEAIFIDNPEATISTIYHATDGIPRLINQVCDHTLMLAYLATRKKITAADVEEAWADLQQLPAPVRPTAAASNMFAASENSSVVEFGELDSETMEQPEAKADYASEPSSEQTEVELEFKQSQHDFTNPFDEEFAEESEVLEGVDLQIRDMPAVLVDGPAEVAKQLAAAMGEVEKSTAHAETDVSSQPATPATENVDIAAAADVSTEETPAQAPEEEAPAEPQEIAAETPQIEFPAKGEIDVVYPDPVGLESPTLETEPEDHSERLLEAIAHEFGPTGKDDLAATFDAADRLLAADLTSHTENDEEAHAEPDVIPLKAPVFSYPQPAELSAADSGAAEQAEAETEPKTEPEAEPEEQVAAEIAAELEELHEDAEQLLDPADDPVMPELSDDAIIVGEQRPRPTSSEDIAAANSPHVPAPHRSASSPLVAQGTPDKNSPLPDDRDLLVLEDEIGPKIPAKPVTPKPARRRAYGQLFASLRKG